MEGSLSGDVLAYLHIFFYVYYDIRCNYEDENEQNLRVACRDSKIGE